MINKVLKSMKEIGEWQTTSLHTFQPSRYEKKTKEPLHANPLQKKKHGSTTLLQDPCSLLLNHRSIYGRGTGYGTKAPSRV